MKKIFTLFMATTICGLLSAQVVSIPDANFKTILTTKTCADFDGDGVLDGDVDTNDDGEIQVSEAEAVYGLEILSINSGTHVTDMNGISSFKLLKKLKVDFSPVPVDNGTLDLTNNLDNLEDLYVNIPENTVGGENILLNLLLNESDKLKNITIYKNDYYPIKLGNDFDLTKYPNLENVKFFSVDFSEIDFSLNGNIKSVYYMGRFSENLNTKLKFGNHPNLESLYLEGINLSKGFEELDFSGSSKLIKFNLERMGGLKKIILKNNSLLSSENLSFPQCNDLEFICVDQGEVSMTREKVKEYGYNNCEVSANCNAGENIPDNAFRYYLRTQICADLDGDGKYDADVDANDDGVIQASEAEAVVGLKIESTEGNFINNIKGIELFSNLKNLNLSLLKDGGAYDLSSIYSVEYLDVSVEYGNMGANSLHDVNIVFGDKPKLKALRVNYFDKSSSAGNIKSDVLKSMPLLESVSISRIRFKTFDFSSNKNLNKIEVYWGVIYSKCPSFIIGNKPNLEIFKLGGFFLNENPDFDFSLAPKLKVLELRGDGVGSVNLKNGVDDSGAISKPEHIFSPWSPQGDICVDKIEEEAIKLMKSKVSKSPANITTYCSFTPGGDYYTLIGNNKVDGNSNGCDKNDGKYPSLQFVISGEANGKHVANYSGSFSVPFEEGSYTITPKLENPENYSVSPESITVTFPQDGDSVTQNFCVTPLKQFKDVEVVMLPLSQSQAGKESNYNIIYTNNGSITQSGTINLTFNDNFMDLVASVPNVATQNPNKLSWSYTDLKPFETRAISLTMLMNSDVDINFPLNVGERLVFNTHISPEVDDINLDNNSFKLEEKIVPALTPNISICLEGDSIEVSQVGDYIYYTIHFENTGDSDVGNVVVKNQIDLSKFDFSSLITTYASHPFVTSISNNIIEFIFENINLTKDGLLEGGNKGHITFKIKTLSSLKEGDTFNNSAQIYFDTKSPIIVNSSLTTVRGALSTSNNIVTTDVKLYPNPVSSKLNISSKNDILSIHLLDITGKQLQTSTKVSAKNTILDLSHLKRGVYFIRVNTVKGLTSHKIVKK